MPADGARRFNGQVLASANASSSLAQSHAVSAGVPCCVRGKQQHTPWVRAQSDDPYSRQLAGHLCITTRCPPASLFLPTASRALSNELLTSLIGLSQRGLQLVWSLSSPRSTTTTPTVRSGRLLEAKPSKFFVPADGCATADQRAAHNARKLSATGPFARPGTLLPQSTTTTTTALGGRPVQALLRIAVALVFSSLTLGLQATHSAHELFAPGPSAKHKISSQAQDLKAGTH